MPSPLSPPSRQGYCPTFMARLSNFRIKIKIREQLSILVALTAVSAVGILSLIFVRSKPNHCSGGGGVRVAGRNCLGTQRVQRSWKGEGVWR